MNRSVAAHVLWIAACGHSAAPLGDAPPSSDAVAARYCPGLTSVSFTGTSAYDIASDGTNVYASLQTAPDRFELQAIPLAGGAATTVASATMPAISVAATDGAVFYLLPLAGNAFEAHERDAQTDAVLGMLAAEPPLLIAGNATDVYVISGGASSTTVTRFPRDGSGPHTVTTYAQAMTQPVPFALGTTRIAWSSNAGIAVAELPGPSTVGEVSVSGARGIAFSNDIGIAASTRIATSRSHWVEIDQFAPSTAVLEVDLVSAPTGTLQGIVGDARYFYVEELGFSEPDQVFAHNVDFVGGSELCEIESAAPLRQDATHLLQLVQTAQDQWRVDIFPKP